MLQKLGVYNVTQQAAGIVANKRIKGKILAKRINVLIEDIKHSKNQDRSLKWVKEIWSEKEGSQRERNVGLTEAPACSIQRSTLSENQWAGTHSLWNHAIIGVKINK